MENFIKEIAEELIGDDWKVKINETKKKLNGISMKTFCH
jgi:hypothetical protein